MPTKPKATKSRNSNAPRGILRTFDPAKLATLQALDCDDPHARASAFLSRVAAKCPRMLSRAVNGVENVLLAGEVAA